MSNIKSKEIKMVSVHAIVPNPKNANRHSIEQIKRLEKLIEHNGFRVPLIVSNRTGFLVSGHGRLDASKNLGLEEVPVIYQDFENDADEYMFLVSDNEIARWSELDYQSLYEEMKELDIPDVEFFGIEKFKMPDDIEKLDPSDYGDKNAEIDTDNFGNDLEHTCPKCGFEFND